jgi:hypothetical protein
VVKLVPSVMVKRAGEAAEHGPGHRRDGHDGEHARGDEALVERAHDRLVGAELHEERAAIEVTMQAAPMASG